MYCLPKLEHVIAQYRKRFILSYVFVFATSRAGYDNILKWNPSEDTVGNCVKL